MKKKKLNYTDYQKLVARKNGISQNILTARLCAGWDIERAMTEPICKSNKGKKYKKAPNIIDRASLDNRIQARLIYSRLAKGYKWDMATLPHDEFIRRRGKRKDPSYLYRIKAGYSEEVARMTHEDFMKWKRKELTLQQKAV